ncbi:uncharacterized protein LOC106512390, partial [Austrofundulus limnaeus]|uniref:Uncharacterized protein LOC106512390 n=1 Tax=Austrofundulus limnaeus TaxID=52670 RepID=A0A2I4ALW4_AUSLI
MTSGADLVHYGIIHVPVSAYKKDDDMENYVRLMMKKLERGLYHTVQHGLRRVVISTCGLRSGDLPWDMAEKVAVRGSACFAQNLNVATDLKEIVVVTAEKLKNERLNLAMPQIPIKTDPPKAEGKKAPIKNPPPKKTERGPAVPAAGGDRALEGPVCSTQNKRTQRNRTWSEEERQDLIRHFKRCDDSCGNESSEEEEPENPPQLIERPPTPLPHESSDDENDESSMGSAAAQGLGTPKQLRIGQRKGEKRQVELVDVLRVSERLAREPRWGPIQTSDGRRTYVPEADQRDFPIPTEWAEKTEEQLEIKVRAKVGEWANIIMMPSYPTLAAHTRLTANFRQAYVAIAHDVMLKKMKNNAKDKKEAEDN